jgi:hypothetical protein
LLSRIMPVKSAAGRISNGLILTPGCFEINTSRSALPEFDDELTAKTGSPRPLPGPLLHRMEERERATLNTWRYRAVKANGRGKIAVGRWSRFHR